MKWLCLICLVLCGCGSATYDGNDYGIDNSNRWYSSMVSCDAVSWGKVINTMSGDATTIYYNEEEGK